MPHSLVSKAVVMSRKRFTGLEDATADGVGRGCALPSGVSVLWTALAPVPIRAEKPNDQPSGEPGEQDAQNYRDKRLHNKTSRDISRSWMSSICRADQGLKSNR